LLEKCSVNTKITNNEGDSAHNLAVTHGHGAMAGYLLRKGCSAAPNAPTLKRSTDAEEWLTAAISSVDEGLVSSELVLSAGKLLPCPSSPNFNPPESPLSEEGAAAAAAAEHSPEPAPEPEPEPEPEPAEEGIPPAVADDV